MLPESRHKVEKKDILFDFFGVFHNIAVIIICYGMVVVKKMNSGATVR